MFGKFNFNLLPESSSSAGEGAMLRSGVRATSGGQTIDPETTSPPPALVKLIQFLQRRGTH